MKLSKLKEARHVSHGFKVQVAYNKALIEEIKENNVLAEDMSDQEIIENVEEYLQQMTSEIGTMMEQLDWFNY